MISPTARRVLVVDEARAADLMAQQLRALGYDVVGMASDGPEAIQRAGALAPELVLMELDLPGQMDGAEAARHIRETSARPVVFVSNLVDPAVLKRAKEAEPYGYILKPFTERDLLVQIEIALHRFHLEQERNHLQQKQAIANDHLQNLRGMLPICAGCKKIHEQSGAWLSLEDYFAAHANVEVTHGFCPDCENRLYGTQSRPPIRLPPTKNPRPEDRGQK